jgi:hypothetical protein
MLAGSDDQDDPKRLRERIHRLERELEQTSRAEHPET